MVVPADLAKPRVRVPAGSMPVPPVPAYQPRSRGRVQAMYMRGEKSPFFWGWRPALREWSDDVAAAYTMAAARSIDMLQNSGWLAGGVDQAVASTVGTGLQLAAKPDAEALGWTLDTAQAWARTVERRWEGFAKQPIDCDIEGKSTIGKMTAQALRCYLAYGEITAALPFLKRVGGTYGTKVQMLPPNRLSQRSEPPRIAQGVRRDETGFPLGYIIDRAPDQIGRAPEREIPARDPFGRVQFVHVFDGMPGQVRGITPIAPVLRVVKQYDQLADATLSQSLIHAIFAATVKSPAPTDVVLGAFQDLGEQGESTSPLEAMMESKAGWYESTQIDLGSQGKIAHLAPGDELNFHGLDTPSQTYEPFTRGLLREVSRCLGITFEQFSGDYSGASYSSVRMGSAEMYLIVLYRRANVLAPFLQPIVEGWLEEEIENGWINFPGGVDGFIAQRSAAARCFWRGPAKPQADDLKFARACETLRKMGVVTDEWICAELGDDWEDTYEQRKREQDKREQLGLKDSSPAPMPGNGVPGMATDDGDDEEQDDEEQAATIDGQ